MKKVGRRLVGKDELCRLFLMQDDVYYQLTGSEGRRGRVALVGQMERELAHGKRPSMRCPPQKRLPEKRGVRR